MVVGYIFTFINYIAYCTSRFQKKKSLILTLDLIAKICTIIALYFLGSLSGSYSMFISFISIIIFNIKERYKFNKYLEFSIYILLQIGYILVGIFTFSGISTILIFITSSVMLFANCYLSPQKMRFLGVPCSMLYLGYQISIKNWVGLLEILVILSNIISFKKYKKLESQSQSI